MNPQSTSFHKIIARVVFLGIMLLLLIPNFSGAQESKEDSLDPQEINFGISEKYRKKVENWYYQGEFGEATESLEYLIRSKKLRTRDDSVFVYKYLGIIYASDIETETKGENYLYKMLTVSPEANVSDMRLSEYLESLFYRVSYRFYQNQLDEKKIQEETLPVPQKKQTPPAPVSENKGWSPWLWVAGTGVAAVAGTLTWYFLAAQEKPAQPLVTTGEL